ncbi:GDSL-type esterase/lipase family protein [Marinoscillum sp. MHG1-6]|uniref:GDSL-type esterase/lipase family protein n=1 Tax=Marinoscillum sp. MHG1-6 TaxID=2959627 RepID=UPI002157EFFA|nr:GDSL-type esterase/lipase family protein [Marinoscillum sp. MHG1-6]
MAHFKTPISILILTLISWGANAQQYKVRMALIGNSITYGAGLDNPATENYGAQLGALLATSFNDTVEIMNYGVSAHTMMRSAELPIWNRDEFKNALEYVPDICLILLGTNDSKPYRWEAWGDEFLGDYLAMIDTFQFRNPNTKFIVCYPPPIWEGHPYGTTFDNSHNDSIVVDQIIPLIDLVAEQTGATKIDLHALLEDRLDLFPDKLHPNKEGSGLIAQIIYDTLMTTDLIHQIDAGLAFVSVFEQLAPAPVGGYATLSWKTLFATSAELNGKAVDPNGTAEVIVENKVYTLTAIGQDNTASYSLYLDTYEPVKTGISISLATEDYKMGGATLLNLEFTDQKGIAMAENTSNVSWSLIDGEGTFGAQSDTSIKFHPSATGRTEVQAICDGFTTKKAFIVNSLELMLSNEIYLQDTRLYPNPAHKVLNVAITNSRATLLQVKIYNLSGEMVRATELMSDKHQSLIPINIANLPGGMYLLTIGNGGETIKAKFLKD